MKSPFGDDYNEVKLGIGFRILAGQIVMQFSDHVEWIRMTSGGARKLAARLAEKVDELDRRGRVPDSGVKSVQPQKGGKSVTPRKNSSRRAGAKRAE